MDWDDFRIFLAVSRAGSVRGAVDSLGMSQSTIGRRICSLEKKLGTELFKKMPHGYELTPSGRAMISHVEGMEDSALAMENALSQQDTQLSGKVRLSMPVPLTIHAFMPLIAEFSRQYPQIQVDLDVSSEYSNLAKREADVVFRLLPIETSPPPYLIGKALSKVALSGYMLAGSDPDEKYWLGNVNYETHKQWLSEQDIENLPPWHHMDQIITRFAAVKAGLGKAVLPCVMADPDPHLVRVPPGEICMLRQSWILAHPDLLEMPRVRALWDYLKVAFKQIEPLLEGRLYSGAEL